MTEGKSLLMVSRQRKKDVQENAGIFWLGTDSSPWAQNDKSGWELPVDTEAPLSRGLFKLGTDSSPWTQNDKSGGNCLGDTRRILLRRGLLKLGTDSLPWAQNDNSNGDYSRDTHPPL